jgi:hypothetical protein
MSSNKVKQTHFRVKINGKLRKYRLCFKKNSESQFIEKCSICINPFSEKTCTLDCGHKFAQVVYLNGFKKNLLVQCVALIITIIIIVTNYLHTCYFK